MEGQKGVVKPYHELDKLLVFDGFDMGVELRMGEAKRVNNLQLIGGREAKVDGNRIMEKVSTAKDTRTKSMHFGNIERRSVPLFPLLWRVPHMPHTYLKFYP